METRWDQNNWNRVVYDAVWLATNRGRTVYVWVGEDERPHLGFMVEKPKPNVAFLRVSSNGREEWSSGPKPEAPKP